MTVIPLLIFQALLEFEERQGPVVSKKLSGREIQRFPTKVFKGSSGSGGGNTQCVSELAIYNAEFKP